MFSIGSLKRRARQALFENFWRSVLVGLIVMLLCNNSLTFDRKESAPDVNPAGNVAAEQVTTDSIINFDALLAEDAEPMTAGDVATSVATLASATGHGFFNAAISIGKSHITFGAIFGVISLVLTLFVFNILQIGGCRFYINNTESSEASMSDLLFGFKSPNYQNMVTAMLVRDLTILLWSMLFIIPGVVKAYELMLVPYVLAEDETLNYREAMAESKRLMFDAKWDAFLLDLSFIGWRFLSSISLQIVGIFYANPYEYATKAEMYRELVIVHEDPDFLNEDLDEEDNW